MTPVGSDRTRIPTSIATHPTNLPCQVLGYMSPKPTVVTVTTFHQNVEMIVSNPMAELWSLQQNSPSRVQPLSDPSHSIIYAVYRSLFVRFISATSGQLSF